MFPQHFKLQLSTEDIEDMREAGETGTDIIKALIENSATFASKTSFSQVFELLIFVGDIPCTTCEGCASRMRSEFGFWFVYEYVFNGLLNQHKPRD
jgi:hypothetical protein